MGGGNLRGDYLNPMTLHEAAWKTQVISAGKTLYLRGNKTHRLSKELIWSLSGSAQSPILITSAAGEWARIDLSDWDCNLPNTGANLIFRDLEILSESVKPRLCSVENE